MKSHMQSTHLCDNLLWNTYNDLDKEGNWAEPYQLTKNAVSVVKRENSVLSAIDVGSGKGRDTRFLLNEGFKVLAIENDRIAHDGTHGLSELKSTLNISANLMLQNQSFAEMNLDAISGPVSLIIANYSIPYAGAKNFPIVMEKISTRLSPGGRFVGTFFGNRCSFVQGDTPGAVAAHTAEEVNGMLCKEYEIEYTEIEHGQGLKRNGATYEKDFIHIMAKKQGMTR